MNVDSEGYEAARERARTASRGEVGDRQLFTVESDLYGGVAERHGETEFTGYGSLSDVAEVVALTAGGEARESLEEGESGVAILTRTPFYAEGGGQVGDVGKLEWPGGAALVTNTKRSSHGLYLHELRVARGRLQSGQQVSATVDPSRRETEKHHTATHLLHAALRTVLGSHVAQAGSLVAADRLRFDFAHNHAMTPEEIRRVEQLVNRWIQADLAVDWREVPLQEARAAGAMMLFGEKYGERVRMVTIDGDGAGDDGSAEAGREPRARGAAAASKPGSAVSIELCGGTHVTRSGTIGAFVIVSEEAVSAGVRRIEARVGASALDYLEELRASQRELLSLVGGNAAQLTERVEKLVSDLKAAQREASKLRDKLAAAQTSGPSTVQVEEAGGFSFATFAFDGLDAAALRNAADSQLNRTGADVVVVGSGNIIVAKTSAAARDRGANAGSLVRAIASKVGGGGGGKPDMAQAGLKDPASLEAALAGVAKALAA